MGKKRGMTMKNVWRSVCTCVECVEKFLKVRRGGRIVFFGGKIYIYYLSRRGKKSSWSLLKEVPSWVVDRSTWNTFWYRRISRRLRRRRIIFIEQLTALVIGLIGLTFAWVYWNGLVSGLFLLVTLSLLLHLENRKVLRQLVRLFR